MGPNLGDPEVAVEIYKLECSRFRAEIERLRAKLCPHEAARRFGVRTGEVNHE